MSGIVNNRAPLITWTYRKPPSIVSRHEFCGHWKMLMHLPWLVTHAANPHWSFCPSAQNNGCISYRGSYSCNRNSDYDWTVILVSVGAALQQEWIWPTVGGKKDEDKRERKENFLRSNSRRKLKKHLPTLKLHIINVGQEIVSVLFYYPYFQKE